MLNFRLRGDFSVTTSEGTDVTPKSKKAIGLLALLVECDSMLRSRRWLEAKLWSDRAPAQARGSLRTALSEIRKCFGVESTVLGADRKSVWLAKATVGTDLEATGRQRDFLEGLDIGDTEFNDWLTRKRAKYDTSDDIAAEGPCADQDRPVVIQCGGPWLANGETDIHAQIVNDQVGKIVSDFIAVSVCSTRDTGADLVVRTAVKQDAPRAAIYVQVIDPKHDEIIHSDHFFTNDLRGVLSDQKIIGRFCWNIADLALEKLPKMRGADNPVAVRSRFAQEALREVLSFREDRMRHSIGVLDRGLQHLQSGLFHALKAWSMASQVIEGYLPEDAAIHREIRSLLKHAQELGPHDAIVAAISANVQSTLFEDYDEALEFARRALRENPNSVFALQAMSVCRAASGDLDMAYEYSDRSRFVSGFSKFEAMCNLHHALLCIRLSRLAEATESSRAAAEIAPGYRAPKRQLIALGALQKEADLTDRSVIGLRDIEPDFSMERFLFDRSYPTNTLRKTGYLAKAGDDLRDKI